jgi:hypothetical protein
MMKSHVTDSQLRKLRKLVCLEKSPMSFTQWSADNVDHNVATLDDLGTFHGMGIISMSVHDHT